MCSCKVLGLLRISKITGLKQTICKSDYSTVFNENAFYLLKEILLLSL